MSKQRQRLLKAVEKFRKQSEKDLAQTKALQKKCEALFADAQPLSTTDRLFERLRQKEMQAGEEIGWADGLRREILDQPPEKDAGKDGRKKAGAKAAKASKPKKPAKPKKSEKPKKPKKAPKAVKTPDDASP